MIEAALALKPRLFLLENVPGMKSAKRETHSFLDAAAKLLETRGGYRTDIWRLNASAFGVPQDRIRLFLVASRLKVMPVQPAADYHDIRQPGARSRLRCRLSRLTEAIFDLPERGAGEGVSIDAREPPDPADDPRFRRYLTKFGIFRPSRMLYQHTVRYHNPRDLELYAMLRPGEDSIHVLERHGRGRPDALPPRCVRRQVRAAPRRPPVQDDRRPSREGWQRLYSPDTGAINQPSARRRGSSRSMTAIFSAVPRRTSGSAGQCGAARARRGELTISRQATASRASERKSRAGSGCSNRQVMLIGRLPLWLDVSGRTEEVEGLGQAVAALVLAAEQQDGVTPIDVLDVASPGGRVGRGRALRLPVEQPLVDGVILVHCRRRVVFLRLVQGDEEDVGPDVLGGGAHPRACRAGGCGSSVPGRRAPRRGCTGREASVGRRTAGSRGGATESMQPSR